MIQSTPALRAPRYYGHPAITDSSKIPGESYRRLTEISKLPLLRTLATTDLRTLYSVPTSQFYCFLSRYSGHRAASWNICTHSSLFYLLFETIFVLFGRFPLLVHQSKFLHLFLLRPSLQSRCQKKFFQSVMIQMVDRPNTTPIGQDKKTFALTSTFS